MLCGATVGSDGCGDCGPVPVDGVVVVVVVVVAVGCEVGGDPMPLYYCPPLGGLPIPLYEPVDPPDTVVSVCCTIVWVLVCAVSGGFVGADEGELLCPPED